MADFDTDSIIGALNAFIPVIILMMLLGVVFKALGSIKF